MNLKEVVPGVYTWTFKYEMEDDALYVRWDEDITPVKPYAEPKPAKALPPQDTWLKFGGKKYKGNDTDFIKTSVNEPPICCEDKPKALQPRDRFKTDWRPGQLECDKGQGGCGTEWEKL